MSRPQEDMRNSIMGTEENQPIINTDNVNYGTFWIIPATIKSLKPQEAIENYISTNLILTVFETLLVLPFTLITPGILMNYMNTILSWIIVVMVLLNFFQLILIILNFIKVRGGNYKISCLLFPMSYFYHVFATLVYTYILWGSKSAFAKFNIGRVVAALFMTVILVLHVMMVRNTAVFSKAVSNLT